MKRSTLLALAAGLLTAATVRAQGSNPVVVMDTSLGKIKVELFQDKAPDTAGLSRFEAPLTVRVGSQSQPQSPTSTWSA